MKLPASIQGRLLLAVMSAVLSVWLGTAAMTWLDARHELDELLDSHLAQAAALLVVQQAQEGGEDEHGLDAPILHRYAPKVAFQVFHEGQLTMRSANAPTTPMATARSGFSTAYMAGVPWRVFATRGSERDVQVYVGEQLDARSSILWAVLRSTLWPILVALPLLGLAIWWAVARGLTPLRRLQQALAARPADDLQPISVVGGATEMAPVLDALNDLFARIEALMTSERRFTADAAHELRTPIAAIRTQAQVALAELDADLRQHALQSTVQGCDRAARLVDQLLTLSRLEARAEGAFAHVDVSALVRQTVAELAPHAIDKQQAIEVDAPLPNWVMGNATLLGVLVRNLVDNAIRYAPRGAAVQVAVAPHEGGVRLRVQDSGPGMSEADMQRIGERFFRVMGTGESGSGLGWSIVQRIAAVHGARVMVMRSASLGGLSVAVQWPAAKDKR
jgi:two-component system sensor histidine kinase QseC